MTLAKSQPQLRGSNRGPVTPAGRGARAVWFPALLTTLVVVHAFVGDRVLLAAATGGRGFVSVTGALTLAAVTWYVAVFARDSARELLSTKQTYVYGGMLAGLTILLPVLGVLFMGYPLRTVFASTEGGLAFAALAVGYVLRTRTLKAPVITASIVALLCVVQLAAALIQAQIAPTSLAPALATWDASIREALGPEQVVMGRAIGTSINPNTLGFSVVIAVLYGAYFLRGSARIALVATCLGTLILSQSRGALIAFVGATIMARATAARMPGRSRSPSGFALMLAGLLLVVCVTAIPARVTAAMRSVEVLDIWAQRTESGLWGLMFGGNDENLQSRFEAWTEALDFSAQYPLGTLGPPQVLFERSIDNDFVRLWCQGGVLALGAFVGMVSWALATRQSDVEARCARHLTMTLAVAAGSAVVLPTAPVILVWLCVGMTLAAHNNRSNNRAGVPVGARV